GRARAVVGTGVLGLDEQGGLGALHGPPTGAGAVAWHALFGAPFFHPTVLVDRELLDRHGLRYDVTFGESEDYELWTRLLTIATGDNLADPLVIRRVHPGQASRRRQELQRELQRAVALGEIARVAPELPAEAAELAWLVGSGLTVPSASIAAAADAFVELLHAFERASGRDRAVRRRAARTLARLSLGAPQSDRAALM